MASNRNYALEGRLAAKSEFRRNPEKTWPCPVRKKCAKCGEIIEVGDMIKRYLCVGVTKHADC